MTPKIYTATYGGKTFAIRRNFYDGLWMAAEVIDGKPDFAFPFCKGLVTKREVLERLDRKA